MSLYSVPRCQHLKVNGTQCGSPALKRNRFCFFHKRFQEEQIKLNCDRVRRSHANFYIPVLEDANSIQVSLMQIMRLLASRQIDAKIAGLLLYALQTASFNLRHLSFEPFHRQQVVIDRSTIGQTCINGDQWSADDFPDPEETEEEIAAAAAAEEAAIKAAAKEKARRHAAIEAEADRLIRQGALARLARSPVPAPAPSLPPTLKVPPPQPQATARVQTAPVPAHVQPGAPAPAPRVETSTRVETGASAGTSPRMATGTLASPPRAESKGPVERSSTGSATNPAPAPLSPPTQPPPPPAAKPQPEARQASAAQPGRPSPTPKPRRKKPPKRLDMNEVREQIRGLAQDWIIQTAKQSSPQTQHRSK